MNLNWGHWIRFPVPAVSPHHTSVRQTHHPSHLKSPLTGPAAASPWLSSIIPADWLVERRAGWWVMLMLGTWLERSRLHERRPGRMEREAGGGGLLLQNSTDFILAHLQNPQEERAAFQVEFPPRNPSEMHTRDYPINISSYAHWGGGHFSSHCTSVSTTGGCRRCPGTVVSPPPHPPQGTVGVSNDRSALPKPSSRPSEGAQLRPPLNPRVSSPPPSVRCDGLPLIKGRRLAGHHLVMTSPKPLCRASDLQVGR